MIVRLVLEYFPDEPDPDDRTGMSEAEYIRLMDQLSQLGLEVVSIERLPD